MHEEPPRQSWRTWLAAHVAETMRCGLPCPPRRELASRSECEIRSRLIHSITTHGKTEAPRLLCRRLPGASSHVEDSSRNVREVLHCRSHHCSLKQTKTQRRPCTVAH